MTTDSSVQILLATYNGSRHLDTFMESLLCQDYEQWSLLVRDDGSTDTTPGVLENWRSRMGERMRMLPDSGLCNLGVTVNFSRLLNASTAPYIMFADQDDVWHPDKISVALTAMSRQEAAIGNASPILVHTDLALVDEYDQTIAPSHWRQQGLVPDRGHELGRMMVENIACGCASMLNRSLANLAGDIPREARFHDWWVALVAAAFGVIVSLPQRTIDWRRHSTNESEITRLSEVILQTLTGAPGMRRRITRLFEESRPRVRLFLERYRERLKKEQIAAIEAFINLPNLGPFEQRRAILQHRLFFTSLSRTIGLLLLL